MELHGIYERICENKEALHLHGFNLVKSEEDCVEFHAKLSLEEYDDDIYAEFVLCSSGFFDIRFTFDLLDENLENYKHVDRFNEKALFAKGYITSINDSDYLQVRYIVCGINNDEAGYVHLVHVLEDIVSEPVLTYLLPLTRLTQSR